MITIGDKQFRNLEEQVKKNMDDIQYILEEEGVLNEFGIKIVGQITDSGDLPDPDTYEGEYGDAYAVGTDAPYTIYIYTRANGTHPNDYWFNIGQFPAPSTVPGPTGQQGPKGDTGERGSIWKNGTGAPTTSDNLPDDKYLNTTNGDVYNYNGSTWQLVGNIRGPQGIQGQQGATGPQGQQGIQGQKGEKGDPGPAFVIAGTVASTGQLPDPSTIADNIAYLVGSDNDYDLYVQLQDTQTWQNVGKVEGVQGPPGPQGEQGPMPALANIRGYKNYVAMSQLGIENIFYNESVSLGMYSYTTYDGVAIGQNSYGAGSIAIGQSSKSDYSGISIGKNTNSSGSISIGSNSSSKYSSVSLGFNSSAMSGNSIAIGNGATVAEYCENSIQLGPGSTSEPNLLQVTSYPLMNLVTGKIYDDRLPYGSSVVLTSERGTDPNIAMSQLGIENIFFGTTIKLGNNSSIVPGYNDSISIGDNANSAYRGSVAIGPNTKSSSVAIGYSAKCIQMDGTAIGFNANCSSVGAAIGYNSYSGNGGVSIGPSTYSFGTNSIAIGYEANANNSIQLGRGTANRGDFQVINYPLLNLSNGKIYEDRLPDTTIPVANSTTLGGVMPVNKTDDMTQEVGVDSTGKLYTAPGSGGDLSDYATIEQLNQKQDTLVSGTNIKTINGESVLGSGDLTISGGGIVEDFVKISSGSQTFTGGSPSQISLNGAWGNWSVISLTIENYNTSNIASSWGSSVMLARDFAGHPTFTYKDASGNTAECLVTIVSASNNVVVYPTGGDMTVTQISYIGMK